MENKTYVLNRETGKIELYFEKSEYDALSDDQRGSLRRGGQSPAFLPGRWFVHPGSTPRFHVVRELPCSLNWRTCLSRNARYR